MRHARQAALITSVAALALAGTAAADPGDPASGAEVFNFGQCVSSGFPAPSSGDFGPLVLVFNQNGFVANVPPGLDNPLGQIACPVVGGP